MHKHLGFVAVSAALFTLARNLGNYTNAPLAKGVAVIAAGSVLVFLGFVGWDVKKWWEKRGAAPPKELSLPIHTIRFDYLPTTPIQSGQWTKAYGKQDALWERDSEIPGGLKMRRATGYAMDYRLPQYATLANHIEFTAKYISDAAVHAEVEVMGEDGLHADVFWFAHLVGNKAPRFLSEYHEWQFYISPQDHRFLVDLRQEVRASVGRNGLIFAGVKQIKIRGDISISPIKLRRLD